MMDIIINGKALTLTSSELKQCLIEYGAKAPFAVAINGQFIPQEQHANYTLNDGDCIDVLSPIQGG
ncbi:MAG TPA: thiamine biosynthesis protein ThiS [Pseudoalteromonas sp.]|jgi:sulfur carrier protein|nr:thiamine biosynthesis protein ThiS [Pseudoalteromonas sp. meg-B1]TMP56697.1 thiamine biosynthesis protein ThiS [Pseudoalteromonas sp. S1612]HCP98871.1 thiamine biosynthesis protein ThiS [Pseudoalteromonas sp.]|tara:strand:+ start:851 stop:1048 length:198 start_codon:yes stop_codon:yes gene_type:complete